jgi:hypothetical protein
MTATLEKRESRTMGRVRWYDSRLVAAAEKRAGGTSDVHRLRSFIQAYFLAWKTMEELGADPESAEIFDRNERLLISYRVGLPLREAAKLAEQCP